MKTSPRTLQEWNRAKRLRILRQFSDRLFQRVPYTEHVPITWLAHPGIFSKKQFRHDTIYDLLNRLHAFHRVPIRYRVANNLLATGILGTHGFHLLASTGQLHLIPKYVLTKTNLLLENDNQETVFHLDAVNKCSLLDIVPQLFLSDEIILRRNCRMRTVLHQMAIGGNLNKLPPEALRPDYLSLQDCYGYSVFHLAAANRFLWQIPANLLTAEVVLSTDKYGLSLLRNAAQKMDLNYIPVTAELIPHFQLISDIIRDAFLDSKREASLDDCLAFYPSAKRWLAKIARHALTEADFPHNS